MGTIIMDHNGLFVWPVCMAIGMHVEALRHDQMEASARLLGYLYFQCLCIAWLFCRANVQVKWVHLKLVFQLQLGWPWADEDVMLLIQLWMY